MDLEPGTYLICEVVRANWTQSAPGNTACSSVSGVGAGGHHVTVTSSGTFGGRDFGNYTTGTVSGTKYEDPNADGTLADGTVPAGPTAWTVKAYTDAATPVFGTGTPTTDTHAPCSIVFRPGSYLICEVVRANWTQSAPGNTACSSVSGVGAGGHHVTVTSSGTFGGRDFVYYYSCTDHRALHSFPTRRSSDLDGTVPAGPTAWTVKAYTDAATPVF